MGCEKGTPWGGVARHFVSSEVTSIVLLPRFQPGYCRNQPRTRLHGSARRMRCIARIAARRGQDPRAPRAAARRAAAAAAGSRSPRAATVRLLAAASGRRSATAAPVSTIYALDGTRRVDHVDEGRLKSTAWPCETDAHNRFSSYGAARLCGLAVAVDLESPGAGQDTRRASACQRLDRSVTLMAGGARRG